MLVFPHENAFVWDGRTVHFWLLSSSHLAPSGVAGRSAWECRRRRAQGVPFQPHFRDRQTNS